MNLTIAGCIPLVFCVFIRGKRDASWKATNSECAHLHRVAYASSMYWAIESSASCLQFLCINLMHMHFCINLFIFFWCEHKLWPFTSTSDFILQLVFRVLVVVFL